MTMSTAAYLRVSTGQQGSSPWTSSTTPSRLRSFWFSTPPAGTRVSALHPGLRRCGPLSGPTHIGERPDGLWRGTLIPLQESPDSAYSVGTSPPSQRSAAPVT
jgi:hypothetical protein